MSWNRPRINRESAEPAHSPFLPNVVISYTDTADRVEPIMIHPLQLHVPLDRPNFLDPKTILSFFRRRPVSHSAILGLALLCSYLVAKFLHGLSPLPNIDSPTC